jgi:hypothetical protein
MPGIKKYGQVVTWFHSFVTSELYGDEQSALLPEIFIPGESAPVTNWIGVWVGHQSRSGHLEVGRNMLSLASPENWTTI